MIKVGTLCWLVNLPSDLAQFSGRVVEIKEPLAVRTYSSITAPERVASHACYIVTAAWIAALVRTLGYDVDFFAVAPEYLKPFSDPDRSINVGTKAKAKA